MRCPAILIALIVIFSGSACAVAPDGEGGPSDGILVAEGKADDFLSATAAEYVVQGRATITLEEEYRHAGAYIRQARIKELVGYERILLSWFLTAYLIDKKGGAENADYGGFGAMAKANTFAELDLRQEDELTYSFLVHQLIAGPPDLLQDLPTTFDEMGKREFNLIVGNPSNQEKARLETNREWYEDEPWHDWNPEEVADDQKKTLTFTIEVETESEDAWFDYAELFADDVLTVDVHFGWDYHNDFHIRHAGSMFRWLRGQGFTAPVGSFDDLDWQSGAFTKFINADGRMVTVEVRIFYGKPGGDTDPDTEAGGALLEANLRASLETHDVIIYSGHSGPFSGFSMANWRLIDEGDLDDSEMATVEMPHERYQIVFAEGCDTYHIGEAFRANAAKPDGRYIDIITTTDLSNASSPAAAQDLIKRLIRTNRQGLHQPTTLMSLMNDLEDNSYRYRPMYGIHGIDDNPQVHPYARVDLMCHECRSDADCGGVGNRCYETRSARFCGVACTTDAGCGDGYRCADLASVFTNTIYDHICVPAAGGC